MTQLEQYGEIYESRGVEYFRIPLPPKGSDKSPPYSNTPITNAVWLRVCHLRYGRSLLLQLPFQECFGIFIIRLGVFGSIGVESCL